MDWISVKSELKPSVAADEGSRSIAILVYVPIFAQRDKDDSGIRMGSYYHHSQTFRPDGSMGFEKDVSHWMPLPAPPETV